jgi:hypothetical protein
MANKREPLFMDYNDVSCEKPSKIWKETTMSKMARYLFIAVLVLVVCLLLTGSSGHVSAQQNPVITPVQNSVQFILGDPGPQPNGSPAPANETSTENIFGIFRVPANKRLVIEYVSGSFLDTPTPYAGFFVQTRIGSSDPVRHYLKPEIVSLPSTPSAPGRIIGTGQMVRIYADPDTNVVVGAYFLRMPKVGNNRIRTGVSFSGYLIDAP